MARKKTKRISRKRRSVGGPIFVSPDGGHTVYQQMRNGDRRLVEEDAHARALRELQADSDMWGFEAYALRKKYPTLQKAYDNYKTVWHLINEQDDSD